MKAKHKKAPAKPKARYEVRLKFWKDGEEKSALEGTFSTNSLRAARAEFRKKLSCLLPYDELSQAVQDDIIAAGHVVANGTFVRDTNRMAMLFIDWENANPRPPMYGFGQLPHGFSIQRFDPD
jgi:hypothetical protein